MKKRLTRILSFIIMLTLLLPMIVPCVSAAGGWYYADINDDTEVGKAVNYLYEHDIMKGPFVTNASSRARRELFGMNNFYPRRTVSRMELIMALWNMLHQPGDHQYYTPINDSFNACTAAQREEYLAAIRWAVSTGILDKAPDGMYYPDSAMTKEDVFLMLYRFLIFCGYDVKVSRRVMLLETPTTREAANALQWAVSVKFMNRDADFLYTCTRGEVAVYIHKIYQIYQEKYALLLSRYDTGSSYLSRPANYAEKVEAYQSKIRVFMDLFGATTISHYRIIPDGVAPSSKQVQISTLFSQAFGKAKKLDICYLYIRAHGDVQGICIYDMTEIRFLTPANLRDYIDQYQGTFVVMINSCHSGTFIDTTSPSRNLTGSNRIKVLCSCAKNEICGDVTPLWTYGCGMDFDTLRDFRESPADVAGHEDGRVSLAELQAFVDEIMAKQDNMTPNCYPKNDNTIIFERTY